jgi:hypothetical protein
MSIIKKNFIFIFIFIFLSNCQDLGNLKKVMSGQKINTTDEFLIKKKDPLILPPQHDKLPLPKSSNLQEKEDNTIKSILKTEKNSEIKKNSSMSSLEKKILEELRKN